MSEDPVCGKAIDPEKADCKSEHRGKTYYFCSIRCKQQFDLEPQAFILE